MSQIELWVLFGSLKLPKTGYSETMLSSAYAFGPFILDRERRQLTRKGEPVPIGHRGYVLLETLLDAGGDPVRKETLMERAWRGLAVEEGNLTVQISTLRRQLGDDGNAIIVTVPRIGYRFVGPAAVAAPMSDRNGPPLIAVLPFANLGDAVDDSYFVDGVVADIITELSRFRAFAVISRSASFALRDRGSSNPQAAARELGVRYALEGSIRRMGDRLRVTAQLVDATTGAQLWAERYKGAQTDIFSFQDRITESVVGVVEPEIRKAEIERARRKPTSSLDAYDLYLKALPLIYAPGHDGYVEALALLDRAATLDPGFALAPAYSAWIYEKRISSRLPSFGNSDHDNCIALAHKALAIDPDDPVVSAMCGFVLYRVGRDTTKLQAVRWAVERNPNNVIVLNLAGISHQLSGDADEAYRCRARAYELGPDAPDAYVSLHGMGAAEMMRGNYELAIKWCQKSLATFSDWSFTYMTLASCYEKLGHDDQAQVMVRRLRQLNPTLTLQVLQEGVDRCDDAYGQAVIPSLRKAGLPHR